MLLRAICQNPTQVKRKTRIQSRSTYPMLLRCCQANSLRQLNNPLTMRTVESCDNDMSSLRSRDALLQTISRLLPTALRVRKSCERFHTATNVPFVKLGSWSNSRSTRAQIYIYMTGDDFVKLMDLYDCRSPTAFIYLCAKKTNLFCGIFVFLKFFVVYRTHINLLER